jgi:vancomycin permeability regulator SanA
MSKKGYQPMKPWMKRFIIIVILIGSLLSAFVGIVLYMEVVMDPLIYDISDIHEVPEKSIAIVFGAAVNSNTNLPSDILADRIVTGIDLYKAGKVEKILMSGDNRATHYNEPEIMKLFAMSYGVPEEDIVLDYAGRRTYDTCYRAKHIFQIEEAVLVTQRYHLYRALYTCNTIGVDSVGVDAARQVYVNQNLYNMREFAAQIVAFMQVHLTKGEAAVMGETIDLSLDNGFAR